MTSLPIGKTVALMFQRELHRANNGHYKKSKLEELWVLLLVLTFSAVVGATVFKSVHEPQFLRFKWKELTLFSFAVPILIYAMLKISLVIRWFLYWVVVATSLLFLFDTFIIDQTAKDHLVNLVVIIFVVFELATVFIHFWESWIFPFLVFRLSKRDPQQFWDVQTTARPGFYTLKRFLQFSPRKTFSYVGRVNKEGEPHGFGKWTSEWAKGEVLTGYWENGYPIGPFKSREYSTGYSFSNLRIGFVATDSAEFKSQSLVRHPKFRYGVASIECSTSGKFFSDLPKVKLIYDPYSGESDLETCLEKIVHISDFPEAKDTLIRERIIIDYNPTKGFYINGYTPISRDGRKSINITCTTAKRRRSTLTSNFSEDEYSYDLNSQLLCQSQTTIPLRSPGSFCVETESNSHKKYDLVAQAPDIINSGPSNIYVPTQISIPLPDFIISGWEKSSTQKEVLLYIPGFNCSMHDGIEALGQMMTLSVLPSRIKPIVFGWPSGYLIRYSSVKKIAKSKQTCDDLIQIIRDLISQGFTKVHILCHSMGARLVSNASKEFRKVFHLDKRCSESSDSSEGNEFAELASVTFLNPEYPLDLFKEITFYHLRKFTSLITMYGSNKDIALMSATLFSRKAILGRNPDLLRSDEDLLDMDIVDTTELDMNIHLARHSYFNLNKYIIDDLTEIIVHERRARERESSLVLIKGNVYGFLTAPSYVMN